MYRLKQEFKLDLVEILQTFIGSADIQRYEVQLLENDSFQRLDTDYRCRTINKTEVLTFRSFQPQSVLQIRIQDLQKVEAILIAGNQNLISPETKAKQREEQLDKLKSYLKSLVETGDMQILTMRTNFKCKKWQKMKENTGITPKECTWSS